ncbi:MAG: Crp/Fnr family transcriptional regulator [Lachnospiraceae bacterium]|nr:Crp/Fnr family transcriptional regulator [Lachnospiraceae bacterium]
MEKYFDVLQKSPLFYHISVQNLSAMLSCLGAKILCYHKKETIIAEGSPAKYIGIVLSGSVQILRDDYFGNRSIVASAGPSELFGESFACAGVLAIPVSVIATEQTDILLIDCLKITGSCSNACAFHQQIVYNLLKVVAEKNLLFHQKIEVTSKRTTREKLIAYLLLQAEKNHSGSFEIPYSRQELADYLEVDRSGLSVEISKLFRQGIIEVHQKHFTILKTNPLQAVRQHIP